MKESQRRVILLVCAGAALVFILAAFALPRRAPAERAMSSVPRVSAVSAYAGKYVVRDYGGRLAVYLSDRPDTPAYLLDVYTSALPEADRTALEKGIILQTDEELSRLLEDYGS